MTPDRYSSRFAQLLAFLRGANNWAITLWWATFYSVPKSYVDAHPAWRRHENRHKAQWVEQGTFKFLALYLIYTLRYGYTNNPFEVDARAHEKEIKCQS